jgi:uncharacterized membrane protein (DUF373 family)
MKKIEDFMHNKFYIELILATTLFAIALSLDRVLEFIIGFLYFIIFLEIVRAVMSFIREQRVKIRILIDAFIILTLREFIVNVVKINGEEINGIDTLFQSSVNYHILIFSGVLLFLFFLRWLAHFTSPDRLKHPDSK